LCKQKNILLQAADIKALGSLGRDDLKKLCGDNFPEWISFPQYEQVSQRQRYDFSLIMYII
jgi:hypothetical protein